MPVLQQGCGLGVVKMDHEGGGNFQSENVPFILQPLIP